jgi:hypothetical protein
MPADMEVVRARELLRSRQARVDEAQRAVDRIDSELRHAEEAVAVRRDEFAATRRHAAAMLMRREQESIRSSRQETMRQLREEEVHSEADRRSIEMELLRTMVQRRPELQGLEEMAANELLEALKPYQDEVIQVMDSVMNRRRGGVAAGNTRDGAQAPVRLVAGALVRVNGLKSAPQHNGKVGKLCGHQEGEREAVRLADGTMLLVRRVNLSVADA